MWFSKIRNNSGKGDFSYEYIMIVVTSYFDSNFDKYYKNENKLPVRHNHVMMQAVKKASETRRGPRERLLIHASQQ